MKYTIISERNMQITSKAETFIGFSIKSRKIVWGLDNVLKLRSTPKLIIVCKTLMENSEKKLTAYALQKSVKVLKLINKTLDEVVGRQNCKVIALTDTNLAQAVIDNSENWAK